MTTRAPHRDEGTRSATESSQDTVKGLFGHDSLYMMLWAIQLVLASLLTPVTTRLLGAKGFGEVAAAIAVLQVTAAIAGFSIFTVVQRAYERPDGADTARRLITLSVNVALLTFAVTYATGKLWCPLIGLGPFPATIRYALTWAALSAITNSALSYLRSCNRLGHFAAVSILQSVVAEAVALALVVFVHRTAASYLLGQVLLQAVAVIVALVLARPKLLQLVDRRLIVTTLKYSSALVPAVLSGFVLDASDRLVVHADLGAAAVGRYVVARNIGGFMIILLAVLNAIWMPRLFAIRDAAIQRSVLAASRDGIYGLVLSAMLVLTMASPLLLFIWVPPSYHPGGLLLVTALVAAASLPMAGAQSQTQVLLVGDRTSPVAIGTMIAAGLNLGLNLVLVPILGIDGSALITLGCYGVQLVILTRCASRVLPLPRPSPRLVLAAAVGIGISLGSAALPVDGVGIALRLVVGLAAAAMFVAQLLAMAAPGRVNWMDRVVGWMFVGRPTTPVLGSPEPHPPALSTPR